MLTKLIAIALCCQFTVSVERPRFTVSVDKPDRPEQPVLEIPRAPPVEHRRYLAMFTAQYCGPCQTWKRTVLPQLRAAGHHVQLYEMTEPANRAKYGNRISRYPSFAVIDWHTGEWLSDVMVGSISQATAVRMLARSDSEATTRSAVVFDGVPRPTRFIEWDGWGTIDLETYSRDCNCPMCVSIRGMQREYRRQLRAWQQSQAAVSPDQEGTPHDVVEAMLDQMDLRAGDVLADLGCGDGRILIAAARRGIRGIGVELDPVRADVARRNVRESGVSELITVETGDALDFDLRRATVATAYLYPPLLAKLSGRLRGLRVVATPYHQVPRLPMTRVGDVWFYQGAGRDRENQEAAFYETASAGPDSTSSDSGWWNPDRLRLR